VGNRLLFLSQRQSRAELACRDGDGIVIVLYGERNSAPESGAEVGVFDSNRN
jgi:hypothetical protein